MASPTSALADHLGIGRFAVLAHSLGSAFALACGPALADRLAVIVIASGMGPLPPGEGFHPRSRAEDLCWRPARSYRPGTTVMAADLVRYSRPWGFALAGDHHGPPVARRPGPEDPITAARQLALSLPHCQTTSPPAAI